ncbi:MAG: NADPH-dependent F420 reductase [Burkholderiales bacterium]
MNTNDVVQTSRRDFLLMTGTALAGVVLARGVQGAEPGMKIGIVGSGRVGGALGAIWLKAGHEVMFSSLDLEQDKALAARLGGKARAGTTREAAAFGEALLIAVPYAALPKLGKDLADLIKGKVVLDTCNPITGRDGDIAVWARDKGAGLASAELLPGARLVRAFNAVGAARLPEAANSKERIGMPIAGDDAAAIAIASRLVRDVGFEPVLVGGLAMGKHLIPGTPLAGEHAPEKLRQVAATLK